MQVEEEKWVESMIAIIVSATVMAHSLIFFCANRDCNCLFCTFILQVEDRAFEKGRTNHVLRIRDVSIVHFMLAFEIFLFFQLIPTSIFIN